jgi:hypothetical protein
MKHLVGIGVLVAMALVLRVWMYTRVSLGIYKQSGYLTVVPLRVICFWFLMGSACAWFLVVAWASIRGHS